MWYLKVGGNCHRAERLANKLSKKTLI